jgi:single-strand DNA-binding protein
MTSSSSERSDPSDSNVVVLRGLVSSEPTSRVLATGVTVHQFDLATTIELDGRPVRASVPLSWTDPPAAALGPVAVGQRVVAIGMVRRRFFRSAGVTQSRTEVVVGRLLRERRAKSVRSAIAAAVAELDR